jgi:hypothetical protein
MFISKNNFIFLILMCFFCSDMYLCKKVNQADANCSTHVKPIEEYSGRYSKKKWTGTMTYDLKDKNNKCCGRKTFLSDCLPGRCVYCCRRDMQMVVDGMAFNTNPVPDTQTYSGNPLLKCCSGRTLKDVAGRIYCCSSDVLINDTKKYYIDKSGSVVSSYAMFGYSNNISRDKKGEVLAKCK